MAASASTTSTAVIGPKLDGSSHLSTRNTIRLTPTASSSSTLSDTRRSRSCSITSSWKPPPAGQQRCSWCFVCRSLSGQWRLQDLQTRGQWGGHPFQAGANLLSVAANKCPRRFMGSPLGALGAIFWTERAPAPWPHMEPFLRIDKYFL